MPQNEQALLDRENITYAADEAGRPIARASDGLDYNTHYSDEAGHGTECSNGKSNGS